MHTARFVGKESGGNQFKTLTGNAQNTHVYARKKKTVSRGGLQVLSNIIRKGRESLLHNI